MEKGFTLVELLGVLVILAVLILIAVPVIGKAISDAKQRSYEFQVSQIELAAKSWALDNILFKIDDGDVVTITLSQLKVNGYIDKDITNPIDKKYFPNDMEILITRAGQNSNIELLLDTGTDMNELNTDILVFILHGKTVENVEINVPYIDEGIIFLDGEGSEVLGNAVITLDGVVVPEIDATVMGKYVITYTANNGTNVSKVVRTVNVADTVAPTITIAGPIEIAISNLGNLDLQSGVTVTDNSLEEITYTITGDVEPTVGNYAIAYKAEDSSGNTTEKTRIVKVIAD